MFKYCETLKFSDNKKEQIKEGKSLKKSLKERKIIIKNQSKVKQENQKNKYKFSVKAQIENKNKTKKQQSGKFKKLNSKN